MQLYIFKRALQVSDALHCEGGLVIVAEDRAHAEALVAAQNGQAVAQRPEYRADIHLHASEWETCLVGRVCGLDAQVILFPDAGCCPAPRPAKSFA